MDCVTTKIAEEILVLFEHGNSDTLSRKKIAEHHARRPTTHHATSRFQNVWRPAHSPLVSTHSIFFDAG